MSSNDTIFALATAPGKSGVAVVRLSGPSALPALIALTGQPGWTERRAQYVRFATIDRGLALYFKGPHSFTGEDVAELQCHGSLAVIRELLDKLATMPGLRPAEPGEFTRRAFISGKMDLTEAEGLADLIDAETTGQKTQAIRQMEGELSLFYNELRTQIIYALAQLEAYIDFPEEEIPESVLDNLNQAIEKIKLIIADVLKDGQGERVREGVRVVILGAPNAGKSSLLNALSKRDAAIVSYKAGTTRDVIETHLDIAGYKVILADTAGIREAADEIEEEGVRRALARAENADIKLVLFDSTAQPDAQSLALLDERAIRVSTKADVKKGEGIAVSTKTGEGMASLTAALEQKIIAEFSGATAPFITRNRHRALLLAALEHLNACDTKAALELSCEELRLAAQCVAKITGKIAVDDVLDVIFRQFCIGK